MTDKNFNTEQGQPLEPLALIDEYNTNATKSRREDLALSLDYAQKAKDLASQYQYHTGLIQALENLSMTYFFMSQYDSSLTHAFEGIALCKQHQQTALHARFNRALGTIYVNLADYVQALEYQLQALAYYETIADINNQALLLTDIGITHSVIENTDKAIEYFTKATILYEQADNMRGEARSYNSCCVELTKQGNYDLARQHGEKALALMRSAEEKYSIGIVLSTLGELELAKDNPQEAIDYFNDSLTYLEAVHPSTTLLETLLTKVNLGKTLYDLGHIAQSIQTLDNALSESEKLNHTMVVVSCCQELAKIYEEQGNPAKALAYLKKYVKTREVIINETQQRDIQHLQILHDTQRALAEAEQHKLLRKQDQQRFSRLSKIKDEFIDHATHDIKNPIAVIKTSTYMLTKKIERGMTDDLSTHITQITEQTEKVEQLVRNILDIASIEVIEDVNKAELAFHDMLKTSVEHARILADIKNITIQLTVQPTNFVFLCNKRMMEQIMENLLSNAIKYTPSGGSINIEVTQTNAQLQIKVSDTGIGIPETALPFVFDRFYRVEEHTQIAKGTGLGLNIVKLNVEQHDGTISVASTVNQGTTFTIALPNLHPS